MKIVFSFQNLSFNAFVADFVKNFFISPSNLAISLTNFDEIIWFSKSDIKKIVSILLLSFLFMPANWNSYSKSETALRPLIIIEALYFLHNLMVSVSKGITVLSLSIMNF